MQEEGYVNNVHSENNSEIRGSWIPGTPIKPSVVNGKPLICNELRQVNWSVNEGSQSRFPRELEFHGSAEYTSSNFLERVMGIHSWKPAFPGCAAGLSTFSFTEQLAFADASSSCPNGMKLGAVNGHLFPGFDPQSSSSSLLPASPKLQLGTKEFLPQNNCTEGMPLGMGEATYWHSCDLNSLPSTAVDTVSSGNVSITPATPDMSRRMDDKGASEVPNVCVDGHLINQETNKENEIATVGVDVNEVNCTKEIDLSQLTQLEDHNPDKGGNGNIDLNKMPQLKQRKKKHRPKVITESKPRKRTSKPVTSNPTESKEIPEAKRKYVRRKGLKNASTTPPPKETDGAFNLKNAESNIKSCRRALNFDKEGPGPGDSSSGRLNYMLNSSLQAPNLCMRSSPGKSTMPASPRIESMVENSEGGIVYDLEFSMNRVLKNYLSLPEKQGSSIAPNKNEGPKKKQKADAQDVRYFGGRAHTTTCEKLASISQVMLRTSDQTAQSPNYCTHSTSVGFSEVEGARGLGKGNLENIEQAEFTALNLIGAYNNSFRVHRTGFHTNECKRFAGLQFPEMYMKNKKTEKVTVSTTSGMQASVASDEMTAKFTASCHQNERKASSSTSKENCWISTSQLNTNGGLPFCAKDTSGKIPVFHCIPASGQPKRSTKKRTRGQPWFSEFASIGGSVDFMQPSFSATQAPSIEDLVAESRAMLAVKMPRKRGRPIGNSTEGSMDKMLKQLKHLNINSQMKKFTNQDQQALVPYKMGNQESNALVLYGRDGTVVPFNGPFDAIRKRRARPKVDLDEETSRVWNLLLGNINSEGIDGTDEEKAKRWEDERSVFRGRANSFVARMRLVQGDRRFSKWKGSVVDSVVGVFLTQNVSDHLSSSAFMSLASRFPLKSKGSCGPCHENTCIRVEDSEDTIDWNEKVSNQPVCDRSSVTLYNAGSNEDKEVVNSNESFGSSSGGFSLLDSSKCKLYSCESSPDTDPKSLFHASSCDLMNEPNTSLLGGKKLMDDAILSQSYVLSSQNSTDSSIVLTAERLGSCSESNSEVGELTTRSKKGNFNGPNSPVDLLQMEGATISGVTSDYAHNHSDCLQYDQEGHDIKSDSCNNLNGVSVNPSSNNQLHLTSNSGILEVGFLKMLEEGQSYDIFKSVSEPSQLTTESTSLATVQNDLTVTVKEAPRSSLRNDHLCCSLAEGSKVILPDSKQSGDSASVIESLAPEQNEKIPQCNILRNFSVGTLGGTRSPSQLKNQNIPENRRDESNITEHNASSNKEFAVMKSNTSNEKRGRVPKQQEKAYNWDILRKEALANGKKRGKTINTMDSLDWEAVRSADVGEIANTIKARGMNNMLAERIKAFLNRLHGEHGSIDLEWLRDVPPDKAKEYLLSIRGLGLKSVECVRLLTLHHLAFPVDTNVGRIAVRLGWVPLQPLPESLQLHLLELYPILESIQKYLWPRLCKLDQETLYELHYHMITFGKVFCTKGKPNCNACPLRGECRHFASAFASARLALPGPEEKNLVVRSESTVEYDGSAGIMNPMPLPLPLLQANQPLSLPQPSQLAEAIAENVCEPIIEEPASPEPECIQKSESDIEDAFYEDPDEIPTIKLNIEEFTQNLQSYMQNNMELQEGEMSKALVALTPEVASLPTPKLKNVSRLRTEHQVYELPDSHQLLEGLDIREPDDPCSYLLAIWTPGETANSIECPKQKCNSQESGKLCEDTTCLSCNSIREENSQTVRGTILIPCRTAMRGSFPLNGTYFQVNEVFADHHSSLNPIDVPRSLIWNLPRRTVYFGTSVPTIFKGLSTESIQHCFWRGYVCVRGFDQKTRAPRPLMARLHFPASKLMKQKDQR